MPKYTVRATRVVVSEHSAEIVVDAANRSDAIRAAKDTDIRGLLSWTDGTSIHQSQPTAFAIIKEG